MKNRSLIKLVAVASVVLMMWSCQSTKTIVRNENRNTPATYNGSQDTTNSAYTNWRNYFADPNLVSLIDTALKNNQELNITMQEILIARNEVRAKKGDYLPFVNVGLGAGLEKAPKYTRDGAVEEQLNIREHQKFPEPLGDFALGATFSWELDIWKKLRNAKNAAAKRYLASVEGKNFAVTNLISEIADEYYELVTLDNQLDIIQKNIVIQQNALSIIKQQKDAARVSQLAVNRFEAQLLNTQGLQYDIKQQIVEAENKINFLVGRFPQPVQRNMAAIDSSVFDSISAGIPSQLLFNRPDIRQAEQELAACKLDVKVARASFYPSLKISTQVAFQAFNPAVWFNPASLLYSVFGDLMAPLFNWNQLRANLNSAKSKQMQAVFKYEQSILKAHIEVVNQLSGIENYTKSYQTKANEVDILNQSIGISDNLFKNARADYGEVLLTQREALESKMQLIEIKKKQLSAQVNIYKALGGGWR